MATKDLPTMDSLSPEEIGLVSAALQLQIASLKRAINTEKDDAVRTLRKQSLAKAEALASRFTR